MTPRSLAYLLVLTTVRINFLPGDIAASIYEMMVFPSDLLRNFFQTFTITLSCGGPINNSANIGFTRVVTTNPEANPVVNEKYLLHSLNIMLHAKYESHETCNC